MEVPYLSDGIWTINHHEIRNYAFLKNVVTIVSPQISMTSLALGCWRTSHFCPLVEEVFSAIRELLVTDRVCMPLLHH